MAASRAAVARVVPAMWAHQARGVEFCVGKSAAVLDCEMGTGKSRIAIEVLEEWQPGHVVVFCPKAVVAHWPRELEKYARTQYTVSATTKGSIAVRVKAGEAARKRGTSFVVLNYAALQNAACLAWLEKHPPCVIIFDELHLLKSPTGRQSRAAERIASLAGRRLGLTGTLMPHSPLDVFGEYRAVDPTVFGWNWYAFRSRYAKMKKIKVRNGSSSREVAVYAKDRQGAIVIENHDELLQRIAPLTMRVGKDVLDLPPVLHEIVSVDLPPKALRVYREFERTLRVEVEAGTVTASNGLVKLLRLQQMTSGVAPLEDGGVEYLHTAKQDALEQKLESAGDEPVVVFGRFTHDLDSVGAACAGLDLQYLELSGNRRELEQWQGGEARVLGVQIQAGGLGVDLTRARYCVFLSTGFDGGAFAQALARVHRPGQTRATTYYHVLANDTIDVRTYWALKHRKRAVDAILDELRSKPQ